MSLEPSFILLYKSVFRPCVISAPCGDHLSNSTGL